MPNLLERAGVSMDELVCWEDEVEVRLPDGGPDAVFGAAPLHDPVTTLVGLAANNHLLSPVDKVRLAAFAAAGLRDSLLRPGWLDRRSVAEYARADGLPGRVVERLLVSLTAGLFFLPPERYSALVLFGLLAQTVRRLPRLRIGAFTGPMTEVLAAPLAAAVERAGGQVRTGTPVERLLVSAGRVRGVRAGGERLRAGHVVLATMEGAVVSGRRAARVVLEAVTGAAVLAADPPAELVLVACFGPVGAAEVRIRVDRSGAGSLVTMEERPVSGPLGALRSARLLDLAIHVRNAESLRRLRRLARRQSGTSTGRDS